MRVPSLALLSLLTATAALDNGLARTPPMGWNSWMAIGWSISEAEVHSVAAYLQSSGLQAKGYTGVFSDDGWSAHRDPDTGRIIPDPKRWPNGLNNVTDFLHARNFTFGLYSSASSVACSGRPGSLYYEDIDAQSFASWKIDYAKIDNCAQYALGNSRYHAMADAINRSGHAMVLSTEPFTITPTPRHGQFSNLYRTTNDIEASYASSMNRADLNANWLPLSGPGQWADPDCIMCGHGGVNEAECRSVFAVWAVTKSPLILGAVIQNFTAQTLATVGNVDVIAINQDPLGVPGRKLAAGSGLVSPMHVGLAPCTTANTERGVNGVSAAELVWTLQARGGGSSNSSSSVSVVHTASGRCLATRPYLKRPTPIPVLLPCSATDASQAWALPSPLTITHLLNLQLNASLAAGRSTVWGAAQGKENATLLDAAFGITNLTFEATVLEPPCTGRDCDGYEPRQSWYFSPASGHISLALFGLGNNYHCYEGSAGCYDFTTDHSPAIDDFCLTRVLAISNDGLDTGTGGVHAWGGPLANGDFAMVLENRDGQDAGAAVARWAWLEAPGIGDATTFCAQELYSGRALGNFTGGLEIPLPSHDAVVLRLTPNCAAPHPYPSNVTHLPAAAFALSPADRWVPRATANGTIFLSKWGGATAVAASLVDATAPPYPTAVGLMYGLGSSNGYARVSLNGAVVAAQLNTFAAATGTAEAVFQLKGLPNHPLWVLTMEATGIWQSGSKDSFVEVVGVNVYY